MQTFKDSGVSGMSLIPKGDGLRGRRRRSGARFIAVVAGGQGLPRALLLIRPSPSWRATTREVACLIVDIRMGGMTGLELQDRLIDRRFAPADRLHHRPWRRADGGQHHEEGRDGFHPEALQRRRSWQPGGAHAGARAQRAFGPSTSRPASRDALLAKLTGREAQVLERIVAGRLNKQIADDLGISIKTVEAHRANIMEKLGANTVADLLKIALGQAAAKGLSGHPDRPPHCAC